MHPPVVRKKKIFTSELVSLLLFIKGLFLLLSYNLKHFLLYLSVSARLIPVSCKSVLKMLGHSRVLFLFWHVKNTLFTCSSSSGVGHVWNTIGDLWRGTSQHCLAQLPPDIILFPNSCVWKNKLSDCWLALGGMDLYLNWNTLGGLVRPPWSTTRGSTGECSPWGEQVLTCLFPVLCVCRRHSAAAGSQMPVCVLDWRTRWQARAMNLWISPWRQEQCSQCLKSIPRARETRRVASELGFWCVLTMVRSKAELTALLHGKLITGWLWPCPLLLARMSSHLHRGPGRAHQEALSEGVVLKGQLRKKEKRDRGWSFLQLSARQTV